MVTYAVNYAMTTRQLARQQFGQLKGQVALSIARAAALINDTASELASDTYMLKRSDCFLEGPANRLDVRPRTQAQVYS